MPPRSPARKVLALLTCNASLRDDYQGALRLADMVMPGGLDGLATVARIRRGLGSQKVLIASGYAPTHLNDAARQRGLPWLAKPYTLSGLASAVRNTLAGAIEGTQLHHPGE